MKRYIKVEPICPFVNRPCIKDGWQLDNKITRPCAFYNENAFIDDSEPCLIMRTIQTICNIKDEDLIPKGIDVPWDTEEKE